MRVRVNGACVSTGITGQAETTICAISQPSGLHSPVQLHEAGHESSIQLQCEKVRSSKDNSLANTFAITSLRSQPHIAVSDQCRLYSLFIIFIIFSITSTCNDLKWVCFIAFRGYFKAPPRLCYRQKQCAFLHTLQQIIKKKPSLVLLHAALTQSRPQGL